MDRLIWLLGITAAVGLVAAAVLVWAIGSVHRDRERAAVQWGRRVLAAQDDERRTIARELHDSVVPDLISLDLALAGNGQMVAGQASRIADRLRDLSRLMHPGVLDHLPFDEALQHLVTDTQWPFTVELTAEPAATLSNEARLACYRITQEALTNIHRHAEASVVAISAVSTGDSYIITVRDDGRGFNVPPLNKLGSLGLRSMRERTLAMNGRFTIASSPGQGATITVAIPQDRT